MNVLATSLTSIALLAGITAYADHHEEGEGDGIPTREECEALRQAQADAMETGEEMSDEDRRRLEICERGIEIEMNDGDGH